MITRRLSILGEDFIYGRKRAKRLVCVSSELAQAVKREWPELVCVVIPNGVDRLAFTPRTFPADQAVGQGLTRFAFVGGDWERKGLPIIVDALGRVPASFILEVFGPGDAARIRKRVPRHLQARLVFHGVVDNIGAHLQDMDGLVIASEYETFCLVGFEALACHVPVVTTDIGTLSEVVDTLAVGVVVAREAGSIADGLVVAAALSPSREAYEAALQGFDWDDIATAYDHLLGGPAHKESGEL